MQASDMDGHGRSAAFARRLFAPLPRRYDVLGEVLSAGQNARWRRRLVDEIVAARPRTVLDVASGTAGVAIQVVRRCEARVVAVDISPEMLLQGRSKAAAAGLGPRLSFALGDARRLPFPDAVFDALSFTYLLRYVPDPQATLTELARVVRPGGKVASLEFHVPRSSLLRTGWRLYTHGVMPLIAAAGGGAWYRVGRFLGPSIEEHYRRFPLEAQLDAWRRAGLHDVGCRVMSLGAGVVMWGTRDA